jgi:hypothetical protein
MRRGLELRLQKLERSDDQLPASAICIYGTDQADCERQLQEMQAARPLGRCPIIIVTGVPALLASAMGNIATATA